MEEEVGQKSLSPEFLLRYLGTDRQYKGTRLNRCHSYDRPQNSINVHDSLADGGKKPRAPQSSTCICTAWTRFTILHCVTVMTSCRDREREREREPGRKGGSNTRGEVNRPGIEITYLGL